MGQIQLYHRIMKCFLSGNFVKPEDIGNSYDLISKSYNERFLDIMHKYNVSMLSLFHLPEQARVLDLACGTGFNSEWLTNTRPDYIVDAVDISAGMLVQAKARLGERAKFFQSSMLNFLRRCNSEQYDIIVCSWALKYQPPLKILSECKRVLKQHGQIGVILNSKNTLPEVRKIYKNLLIDNSDRIKKLMLELPNPKDEKQLKNWFVKAGINDVNTFKGKHIFNFESEAEMVEWVTSTGALAGFDIMLDLQDRGIKNKMENLFREFGISSITHEFVWGAAKKC